MAKDIFGVEVPFQEQISAARSNIIAQYGEAIGNQMLGSATPEQISQWSVRQFGGLPTTPPSQPGYDPLAGLQAGGISTSVDIGKTIQEQLAQVGETTEEKMARRAGLREMFRPLQLEAEEAGQKALSGIEAISARAGGLGASAVKEGLIKEQQKVTNKMMTDIQGRMAEAMLNSDSDAYTRAREDYKLASDMQDRLFRQQLDLANARLNQLSTLTGLGIQEAGVTGVYKGAPTLNAQQIAQQYNLDLQKLGIDEKQFNQQMNFNQQQFEESKRQFGVNQALDKLKMDISKSQDSTDTQLKFQTLLNSTPSGQKVSITLPNGQVLSGIGREKITGTGAGITAEPGGYPKGFWTAVKTGVESLQKGEPWEIVWPRVKMQFPNVSNEDIDKALGGKGVSGEETGWAKPGAFEEWKAKQYKETQPRQFELQSGVWSWLATDEAKAMTDEQKSKEIMSAGFNPEDFGIY